MPVLSISGSFEMYSDYETLKRKLASSPFRSSFHLDEKSREYVQKKGEETIARHAMDFINKRLAPKEISNDGKQTPMKGHPVFIAQHATATCCRSCLEKWHGIKKGHDLDEKEIKYIKDVIMSFIRDEMGDA